MPLLAFNLNDGNEFVFDLTEEVMGLGRESDNTIIINNSYISAHHAEFRRGADGSYELKDLGSSNGVRVNGKRIERVVLNDMDKVAFGQLEGRYFQEGAVANGEVDRRAASPLATVVPKKLEPGGPPKKPGVLAQLRAGAGGIPRTGVMLPAGSSEAEVAVTTSGEKTVPIRKLRPEDFSVPKPVGPMVEENVGGTARTESKLAGLRAEMAALEEGIARKREEAESEARRRESEVGAALAKLAAERADAEVAVKYLEEKQGKLEERVAELDRVRVMGEEAGAKRAKVEAEVELAERRVAVLKEEEGRFLAARQAGEEAARAEVEELEKRKSELAGELADLQKEVDGAKRRGAEMGAAGAALGKLRAEEAGLRLELEKLREERDAVREEKATLLGISGELEEKRKELAEAEVRLAAVLREEGEVGAENEKKGGMLAAALEALKGEEFALRSEVDSLKAESASLVGVRDAVVEAQRELEAVGAALEEKEKRLAELEEREGEFVRTVEEGEVAAKARLAELEAEEMERREALAELDMELKRRREEKVELADAGEKLEAVRGLVASAEARVLQLRDEEGSVKKALDEGKAGLEGSLEELRGEEVALRGILAGLVAERAEAEGKREVVRAEAESVEARLVEAKAGLAKLEGERRGAASDFERVLGELKEMGDGVAKLRDEERALRERAEESRGLAGRADGLREECGKLELRVGALRADAENLEREAVERSVAEAVNAVRFAAGIAPDEDPARVLEGKVAEAMEEAKRLREEAEEEVAMMKTQAARYGKKSREFRRMEKEIRKGEKRLVAQEKRALRAMERASVAEAVRAEEKGLKRALAEAKREMEQVERSMKYLKEKEAREKAVVAELEGEVAKLGGMLKDLEGEIEKVRSDMANLPEEGQKLRDTRIEIAEAEGRIDALKSETEDLEERRKLMEVAVNMEEATVLLLGRELIKRVDLVDTMLNHYRYYEANPGVEEQLETFRKSLLDLLKESSIWELAPAPGTPVDIRLRKQMKIVETDGADVSKIMETIRAGFVYQTEDGREIVLRKVEVRTG